MSIKQLNSGVRLGEISQGWVPEKRFIAYEYGKVTRPNHGLPQDPAQIKSTDEDLKRAFSKLDISTTEQKKGDEGR